MMALRRYLSPRRIWVGSWLLAGGLTLLEALADGAIAIETILAFYYGLGAGVEIALYISGRQARTTAAQAQLPGPVGALRAVASDLDLLAGLRSLGFSRHEAQEMALEAPVGLPLEERLREALKARGGGA